MSVGCAGSYQDVPLREHERLQATLWMQLSGEYRATAAQAYQVARSVLPLALEDTTWTALDYHPESVACDPAPLQTEVRQYAGLPPAIIVDVDDTILDNTAFQARLIEQDSEFDRQKFARWVNEAKAPAVPGAVDFFSYAADSLGVEIVYVTNRETYLEDGTRRNLQALGFPLEKIYDTKLTTSYDLVLMLNEYDKSPGGDKHARRRLVARYYRVLMLIGDNLGDFLPCVEKLTATEQKKLANETSHMWGAKWFVLPNPVYGIWEPSSGKSRAERLKLKYEMLETLR
jgi:acid phosphatase